MRTDPYVVRESISEWRVESLRLTSFLHEQADILNAPWIEELIGKDVQFLIDDRAGMGRNQLLDFADGRLGLQRLPHPGIIHWTFGPPTGDGAQIVERRFPEFLRVFREVVDRWLKIAPRLQRLAFGCVLQLPATNREAAYRKLSDYLPFDLDDESCDFSYQINRPRKSTVRLGPNGEVRINRLSRWSAGAVFMFGIQPSSFGRHLVSSFCRLESDINTQEDFAQEIPRELLRPLLDELVQSATELIEQGDIK